MKYAIVKFFNHRLNIHFPSLVEIENCKITFQKTKWYSYLEIGCKVKRVLVDTLKDGSIENLDKIRVSNPADMQEYIINGISDDAALNLFYEEVKSALEEYLFITIDEQAERLSKYKEIKLFLEKLEKNEKIFRKDFKNIKLKRKDERRLNDIN